MDNDDKQVGHILSRREMLALIGAAGMAPLAGCAPSSPAATGTAAGAAAGSAGAGSAGGGVVAAGAVVVGAGSALCA